MDIYERLPYDVKREIIKYFRHPFAQALHDYPWIIREIKNQWPAPPTTTKRIALARMVMNPGPRKRCGCIYWEQHAVCCKYMDEEDLDTWDPLVRSTPIMQAIHKTKICDELKKKLN